MNLTIVLLRSKMYGISHLYPLHALMAWCKGVMINIVTLPYFYP